MRSSSGFCAPLRESSWWYHVPRQDRTFSSVHIGDGDSKCTWPSRCQHWGHLTTEASDSRGADTRPSHPLLSALLPRPLPPSSGSLGARPPRSDLSIPLDSPSEIAAGRQAWARAWSHPTRNQYLPSHNKHGTE
eukprot:652845-Rhodomonas_salina.6